MLERRGHTMSRSPGQALLSAAFGACLPVPTSWWRPDSHADRRPFLQARGRIRDASRAWFKAQGFTEVECGALQVSPGNEAHLHAFATQRLAENGTVISPL